MPLIVDVSCAFCDNFVHLQVCVLYLLPCYVLLNIFFISVRPQYVQNDSPSSKSLAGLVVQLLQFQEDAFGRRVNNPALTKLPVSTAHLHLLFC